VEARLPTHKETWTRDNLTRFAKDPWFVACLELCEMYAAAGDPQRTWIRSRVEAAHSGKVGLFGLRAAVSGAREHNVGLVRAGLIAYAIRDLGHEDIRDVLMGFTLIVHCAGLAGADVPLLLREVAAISGPALRTLYEEWAARYPDVSGIGAMGWRQVDSPDGIAFSRY